MLNSSALLNTLVSGGAATQMENVIAALLQYFELSPSSINNNTMTNPADLQIMMKSVDNLLTLRIASQLLSDLTAVSDLTLSPTGIQNKYAMLGILESLLNGLGSSTLQNNASSLLNIPTGSMPTTIAGTDVQIELSKSIVGGPKYLLKFLAIV